MKLQASQTLPTLFVGACWNLTLYCVKFESTFWCGIEEHKGRVPLGCPALDRIVCLRAFQHPGQFMIHKEVNVVPSAVGGCGRVGVGGWVWVGVGGWVWEGG